MQQQHETYYVPEQSKLPIFASLGLFLTVFGLGNWINQNSGGSLVTLIGLAVMITVLWVWFGAVIRENLQGLNSAQLKRSYVWGMGWFIFSEVMFFAAFFGALFYVRNIALPELSEGPTSELLWNDFKSAWPLMETPAQVRDGAEATVKGPDMHMGNPGWGGLLGWLPFYNTVILLTSSFTVHFAHVALKNNNKPRFNLWLLLTVLLGMIFLVLQVYEYSHAYHEGLMINSGIYGTTFFLLTGFHGMHVFMGTLMLAIQWFRSVLKGHFNHHDCFGFEASSWYWHFVDVVWLGLFIFVYILG